ncbi:MAG: GAF domain-containing protein [Chloroflexi bacterium]|nr:GAF domain-containing protein [Chloroflexota bacterium]
MQNERWEVECVEHLQAALEYLGAQLVDAILLDLDLPDTHELDAFITLHLHAPHVPIVVFAENLDHERARAAVSAGAQSFLTRAELESPRLEREVVYAIERHALRQAVHSHTEHLQFSEARFRLIINENADAIVVVNTLGKIRFANPAAVTLFGKAREELLGSTFRAPLTYPHAATIELRRGPETLSVQMRVVQTVWDREDVYLATLRDVTAQQQIADALRASQERYREFIELSSEGIWRCSFAQPIARDAPEDEQLAVILDQSYIEECNTAMAVMYGFETLQELLGRFAFYDRTRDDPVNLESFRALIRQRHRVSEVETHEHDRCGAPKIFVKNLYGIFVNNLFVGLWGMQRDVTAQRMALRDLERVQNQEAHQRQLAHALADSAAVLNSTLSFEQVVDRILENVGRVVPHDAASIFLLEDQDARLVRAQGFAERGLGEQMRQIRLPVTKFAHLMEMRATQRGLAIPSTRSDPRWLDLGMNWIQSYVGAPLCVRDQVIGFLNVDSATPYFFTEANAVDLKVFADQAATALDNARLHAQVEQRANEWAMVYEMTRELSLQRDQEALLDILVTRSTKMLHAAVGSVALYDVAAQALHVAVIKGAGRSHPGSRIEPGSGVAGRVAQSREPLIIDDFRMWEEGEFAALDSQVAAVLSVPMLFGGDLVGVLSVCEVAESTRRFMPEDAKLLTLIATQAAAFIHNARLLEQTEKRAQQLALVYDAGLTLNRELEPRVQLEFLTRIAMRSVHAERATFFRYEPPTQELVLDAAPGFDKATEGYAERRRVPLDAAASIEAWVARERLPVTLNDAPSDPRFVISEDGLRAGIWVPVEHDNRLLGVLSVSSVTPHLFTADDERLLTLYASQAAIALENARLYQSVLQENERRGILHWASQEVVSAGLDSERVYAAIHQAVSRLMPCEAFALALLNEADEQIHLPYLYDRGGRQPVTAIAKGRGLSGKVIESGAALIIGNMATSHIEAINVGYPLRVVSVLGVPMRHSGKIIGALLTESYEQDAYDDSDRVRLEMLAAHAAAALMNVRGYENLRGALAHAS